MYDRIPLCHKAAIFLGHSSQTPEAWWAWLITMSTDEGNTDNMLVMIQSNSKTEMFSPLLLTICLNDRSKVKIPKRRLILNSPHLQRYMRLSVNPLCSAWPIFSRTTCHSVQCRGYTFTIVAMAVHEILPFELTPFI